jgi:hypothetical protein
MAWTCLFEWGSPEGGGGPVSLIGLHSSWAVYNFTVTSWGRLQRSGRDRIFVRYDV